MSGMSLFPYYPSLRPVARSPWVPAQFPMLHRDLDQILAELLAAAAPKGALAAQPGASPGMILTPHIDVIEGDREVRVTAELPGMSADDIDITLDDDVLVIRGEKKAELRDNENDFHVMERAYGTFARYLRLPFAVDPSKIDAAFKDGVLTVVLPKPDTTQRKSNRIEIKQQEAANPASDEPGETAASGATANAGRPAEAVAAA